MLEYRGPLVQCDWCPYEKRRRRGGRHTATQRGRESCVSTSEGRPETAAALEARRRQRRVLPGAFREGTARLTPRLQTASPENWERMDFCCVKPASLRYSVTAALENHSRPWLLQTAWNEKLPDRQQMSLDIQERSKVKLGRVVVELQENVITACCCWDGHFRLLPPRLESSKSVFPPILQCVGCGRWTPEGWLGLPKCGRLYPAVGLCGLGDSAQETVKAEQF